MHATFTAHGSRNSKLILVLINRLRASLGTAFERARLTGHCPPLREVCVVGWVEGVGFRLDLRVTEQRRVGKGDEPACVLFPFLVFPRRAVHPLPRAAPVPVPVTYPFQRLVLMPAYRPSPQL